MPAAAVIPAPIAYIKVVAVKKLVVEFTPVNYRVGREPIPIVAGYYVKNYRILPLTVWGRSLTDYFEEIRVFKAGNFTRNILAWDNRIGLRLKFVGSFTEQ